VSRSAPSASGRSNDPWHIRFLRALAVVGVRAGPRVMNSFPQDSLLRLHWKASGSILDPWYTLCRHSEKRMRTRIQKWGNSLALRIPRPFAEESNLNENSAVDVTVRNGKLVVTAVPEPQFTLEDLVEQITPQNRHGEMQTGERVGNEVW
jgi:antitoxin MazE